ncbi:ion channel protein [Bizionia saleffrena]|uniref:Ion channel protein n=1 Tax=Bizionia saleffrena TaxID=291189 RepID=A0A8H2LMM7_9FLAO|nr:tetratricopeptide repeat protein [Bizionia saleffrena]TYB75936.1 ion channel protein [Bizionia saleffrena]
MKDIFFIIILFVSSLALAQSSALFEQGNALYNDGKYAEALDKYTAVLETSNKHSAALYFNMANAHYKSNHIAPSIYYYEKAKQLAPNDTDIENNMAFAKNMTIDAIAVIPEVGLAKYVKNLTQKLSYNSWAKTAIGFVVLGVALFLVYYFSQSTAIKRFLFTGSLVSALLVFVTLGLAVHNYNVAKKDNPAIVFAVSSSIKTEPNPRSEEAFTLHEGTKVQILDTLSDWNKIKLTDGKMGWIKKEDVKEL